MKLLSLALVASALSAVCAAPVDTTPNPATGVFVRAQKKTCPDYFGSRGVCNGTSCRFGLINYKCNKGSCVGNGGGDGACCGAARGDADTTRCPNGGY